MASSNKKSLPLDRKIDQKGFFLSIFKKIPLAPIINFLALLSLFAVITFLHHIERPKSAKVKEAVAVPEQTSVQAQVEAPKKARVPRPSRSLNSVTHTGVAGGLPGLTAELKKDMKEEIEDRLQQKSLGKSGSPTKALGDDKLKNRFLEISAAKEIPVEELDTETARLSYLAQNKTTTKTQPTVAQPANSKPQPTSSDFIPFEERFKER